MEKTELNQVKNDFKKTEEISQAVTETKNKNKALRNADLLNLPSRSISNEKGEFEGSVSSTSSMIGVEIGGSAKTLDSGSTKTFNIKKDLDLSATNKLEDSIYSLEHNIEKKISNIYTQKLGDVNSLIKIVKISGWSGYVNSYDAYFDVDAKVDGQHGAICAVYSHLLNYKEDRQFKFKYCTPNIETSRKGGRNLSRTAYDGEWTRECPGNEFMTKIKSWHSNYREDRIFDFSCHEFDGFQKGHICEWSNDGGWYNGWDKTFEFQCKENMILTAIKSVHSNKYEDRLFSFKCCHIMKTSHIKASPWTKYVNSFRNKFFNHAKVDGKDAALCGVSSHHNNHYEDRQFKFNYCRPNVGVLLSNQNKLGPTSYDGHWKRECSGNQFMTDIESWFHTSYKDRAFHFYCHDFPGVTRDDVCEWSNGGHWINKWDGDFTFGCAPNMAIVAIESYQNNYHEDRLFKFKCCRMEQSSTYLVNGDSKVNLALRRPAKQSSTSHGGIASRAVDGNTDGNWRHNSVTHTSGAGWWSVELSSKLSIIEDVIIYNRSDCCGDRLNNAEVQILDLNSKVVSSRKIGTAARVNKLEFGGVIGSKVKLIGHTLFSISECVVNGWENPSSNLALGRPATQSSTSHGGIASRAVDGNTDGNWGHNSVTHTSGAGWWGVVLSSKRTIIKEIIIYNRSDCCGDRLNNAEVQILDLNYKVVASKRIGTAARVNKLEFGGVMGSKVMVIGRTVFSIAECVVNGWDNPSSNLALGRPATQSSTSHGGIASRAVDGNTDGNWGHNSVTHTSGAGWWGVVLSSKRTIIKEIIIYNRSDCCGDRLNNAEVQILDLNYKVVASKKIGTAARVNKLEFGGVTGATVKVIGRTVFSISECVVNGWN